MRTKVIDCVGIYNRKLEECKEYLNKRRLNKSLLIVTNDDDASKVYVKNKIKACEYVGIKVDALSDKSQYFNRLNDYSGVIVQLPNTEDNKSMLGFISPRQDVDGFLTDNVGCLLNKETPTHLPCTPSGIMDMIKEVNYDLTGKHVVIVGRSDIVGKPLAMMMLKEDATVTLCHSKTVNLRDICKQADVLVVAIGKPLKIDSSYVKEGAFVIDVGINRLGSHVCGDVDLEDVMGVARYITTVPGGVGKLTVAKLVEEIVYRT